jgi:hypothetical protein
MGKGKDNIAEAEELQPILEKICDILKNIIAIKSLWMFRHVPQIHSFKSWGYFAIDKEVAKAYKPWQLRKKVAEQFIPEDIGSIGKAFKQEKENQDWLFVPNTYGAPEGTVVELDLKLGHQSVLFVPFKDKDDQDIIAILLLSTSDTEIETNSIQEKIKEAFKKSFINDLVRLAYQNERNKDVIANVKKATMGSVSIDATLEDFVKQYLIDSIKEFNQGTSFVPIIKIEDLQHLQKPQWGYADVVYENLRQKLSDHISGKGKELSNDDPIGFFVGSCKNGKKEDSHEFPVDLDGSKITYVLKGETDVYEKIIESAIVKYKREVETIITQYEAKRGVKFPTEISWIIKKKYISEKLDQTCHKDGSSPFYLILKKSDLFNNDELITCNLDKTLSLKTFREQLIDEKGSYYKYQSEDYSSKIIDGLVFRVFTDEKRKKEEIFNEDVKAFIDQRCLYYKLLLDQKQAKKDAVRAAIAQVMARNMSHNFGSHVYSRLIDDKVYRDLKDHQVRTLNSYMPIFAPKEVFKRGENHQLQFFFQYQKSRMDYLSEITFGVPNLMTTKMMYGDVMKELDRVRILLNHISGVSGFKYKFSLKYNNKSLKSNDIGVAFPSDVLGCHAFYNVVENIIRNTAKHAGKKNLSNKPITFTIHFKDIKGCDGVEGVDELYCVEIDNGVREDGIEELVKNQNERFNKSVLENNKLRSGSLGLLEMEASAAFLRQIDMPEIESDDYEVNVEKDVYFHERPNGTKILNIIRAFAVAVKDEGVKNEKGELVKTGRLGYRFFVQKPKEFLIVGKSVEKNTEKQLLNYGIQIISKKKFIKAMNDEKSFAHQFLLYADNDDIEEEIEKKYYSNYKSLLPLRKLKINDEDWKTISSYWFNLNSNIQLNGETKPEEILNNNKTILQRLKEWAWERYYDIEMRKELDAEDEIEIVVHGEVDPDPKKNLVVFKDHGDGFVDACKETSNHKKEAWVENLLSKTYGKLPEYSTLSVLGKGKTALTRYLDCLQVDTNRIDSSSKQRIIQEIFEAYHNRVIILDERVQKFAEENSEGKSLIPCWRLFRSTNVYIPRPPKYDKKGTPIQLKNWIDENLESSAVFSLDPNDFENERITEKVENYVDLHLKDELHPQNKSFILVHYGVLERMYGGNVEKINNILEVWAKKAKRVVVTSGRGAHSLDLPKSVCFANLSSVLYACNENRNKYIINYLLNQSRRKRNE